MRQFLSTPVVSLALLSMMLNVCGAAGISSRSVANAANGTLSIAEIGMRELASWGSDNSNFNGRTNNEISDDHEDD